MFISYLLYFVHFRPVDVRTQQPGFFVVKMEVWLLYSFDLAAYLMLIVEAPEELSVELVGPALLVAELGLEFESVPELAAEIELELLLVELKLELAFVVLIVEDVASKFPNLFVVAVLEYFGPDGFAMK